MALRVGRWSVGRVLLLWCLLIVGVGPWQGGAGVGVGAGMVAPAPARPPRPLTLLPPPRGFVPAPLRATPQRHPGLFPLSGGALTPALTLSRGAVPLTSRRARRGLAPATIRAADAPASGAGPAPLQGYTAPDPNMPDTASPVDAPSVNTVYGSFFPIANATYSFTATAATPPVFTGQFGAINFNPSLGQAGCTFPANTTPITSYSRPFADVIPQADGSCAVQPAWSADAGHQYQAGVTGTVPLYAFQAVFTATLAVVQPGQVTFATNVDDSYALAIGPNRDNSGQQPTTVAATPAVPASAPKTGPFTGYPVVDAAYPMTGTNGTTPRSTVTVNFPAAGLYPIEVDYTECCGSGLSLMMSASAGGGGGPQPHVAPTTVLLGDQNLVPNDCPCDATQLSVSDPVNTRTGNEWMSNTDLSVDTPGPALTWSRTYSSQEAGDGTAGLGYGWQDGYAARLTTPITDVVTLVTPEGNRLRFLDLSNGGFRPFPGVYDTLVRAGAVYTDTRQSRDQITFDAATGRATAITDPQGRQLLLRYNGQGQLAQITDAVNAGRSLTLAYNGAAIARVSDAAGRSVGYSYDSSGNLTGVTDVMGHTTTYAYGTPSAHLLTGVTNALGQTVEQTTYDTSASPPRVSNQTLQDGTQVALSYAASATTVTTTGPDGRQDTEQVLYDANRNVMTGVVRDGVSTQQEQVDANFSPTTSADGNGNTTATTFNRAGLPLAVTDPLSGTTSVGYDARENPVTVTDQLGRQSLSVYDASNNLVRQTSGVTAGSPGLTTAYTYTVSNGQSLLTDQRAPDGVVTHDTYNTSGQLVAQIVGYGVSGARETDYGYDAAGRVVTTTVGVGTATQRVDVTRYNADDTTAATIADDTGAGVFDPGHPDQNVTMTYGYDALGRQVAVTDTLGHVAATHYDAAGQVDWTERNLVPALFDAQGQPFSQPFTPARPDQDVATLYGYDGLGRQTLVTQTGVLTGSVVLSGTTPLWSAATTRTTRTDYDTLGRPVTTTLGYQPGLPANTLPDVNVQSLVAYDNAGNVVGRRDPLGRWTITGYDALNRPVTTTVNYEDGNPTTVTQPWANPDNSDTDLIGVTRYTPDGSVAGRVDNYVAPGMFSASQPITNRLTQYTYDPLGRLTVTTVNADPNDAGPALNRTTTTAYDPLGRVAGTRDVLGRWTATAYDGLGRSVATTQNCADGSGTPVNPATGSCAAFDPRSPDRNVTTTTGYDALGRTVAVTDALGHVGQTAYDGLGRSIATTGNAVAGAPAGADTNVGASTGYDALGRTVVTTDALGAATFNGYDGLGRTTALTDAVGRVTRTGYDGTGTERWSATPDGRLTLYQLDGLGRVITTTANYSPTAPLTGTDVNLTTGTSYDVGGRTVATTDALGRVTAEAYDLRDHLVQVIRNNVPAGAACAAPPCNVVTQYHYDRAGNRVAVTDPRGDVTGYGYDAADEQVSATDALGRTTRVDYNAAGQETARHDPRGAAADLTYSYDGLGRLMRTAAQNLPAPIQATYDALGERTSLADGTGTTLFGYDGVGRTTAITAPGTGTVGYSYDAAGRRTGLRYPDGTALGYRYDPAGQLRQVSQGGAGATTLARYGYDGAGRLAQVARANGTVTTYGYDGADRVLDQRTTVPTGQVSDFAAAVDRLGQRTAVTETVGPDRTAEDVAIDAGGGTAQPFLRDTDYSGGTISSTVGAIDIGGVSRPAPQAVYQTERQGQSFGYAVPSLTPGAAYTVRLHFAEIDGNAPGQRQFNVAINATGALTNVDIAATVGVNHALVAEVPATADSQGQIAVQYTGIVGSATASGIEILPVTATAGGVAPHVALARPARVAPTPRRGALERGAPSFTTKASPLALPLDATAPVTAAAEAAQAAARTPLSFERNVGQSAALVRYLARGGGYTLFLTDNAAVLALSAPITPTVGAGRLLRGTSSLSATAPLTEAVVRLRFPGATAIPAIAPSAALPGAVTYLRGADPAGWRTGVATYGQVTYHDLYPGVDLVYDGTGGRLEYSFVVAAGADAGAIRLALDGVRGRRLDRQGNLVLQTAAGALVQRAPVAYQVIGGRRRPVAATYALSGTAETTFALGHYDRRAPLVIDPVLAYATYLGGTGIDRGTSIASDGRGALYLTGSAASADFPTAAALQAGYGGGYAGDAFVTKLSPDGRTMLYSTYLGGSGDDAANGIAVDAAGEAVVTGRTSSSNFPTAHAVQGSNGGGVDAFVSKLSASGAALVYSTYLGGGGDDAANGIALDGAGNAYIVGTTGSSGFPTTVGAYQRAGRGGRDAFVTELAADGSALVYSTYVGGSGDDAGNAIALDAAGDAYVAGQTTSSDFPLRNAAQGIYGGGYNGDAFVTELNGAGSALVYSAYLGGSGDDKATGIAVDGAGEAIVTGQTTSSNFPVVHAFQTGYGGGQNGDAFVTKLAAGGSSLVYSTYLGGSGDDAGAAVATDAGGTA